MVDVAAAYGVKSSGKRRISFRTLANVLALTTLSFLGIMGFEPSFGGQGYAIPAIGGLLVGTAVAIVAAIWRIGALTTVLFAIAAFFLFGSAVALPHSALFGFLPTLDSLQSLAIGSVFGWADLITLKTPVGAPEYIAVVPYIAGWIVGVVSITLAVRWLPEKPRTAIRSAVVLIGPILLYVLGVVTGTHDPYLAGVRGTIFAVLALVWIGWRHIAGQRLSLSAGNSLMRRKIAGTAVLIVGSIVLGVGASAVAAPTVESRYVLRDHVVPPFDPKNYPSPLAGFRYFSKKLKADVIFTVSGLREGERIRLATMDSYTGKLWNVSDSQVATDGSGSFNLVGNEIPKAPLLTKAGASTISVKIGKYSDVWMPSVGYLTKISLTGKTAASSDELRYNPATGSAVLKSGLHEGDTYTITADIQSVPDAADLEETVPADIRLPEPAVYPDALVGKIAAFAGDKETPIDQLKSIEAALTGDKAYIAHGFATDTVASAAGHGVDRLTVLFNRPDGVMVGDEEQYAAAFALMARHLGYPARVVLGFAPKVSTTSAPVQVKGADITAWVEVAFAGVGWVAFDPKPTQTNPPKDDTPKPQSVPLPQVIQPPPTVGSPDDLLSATKIDKSKVKPAGFVLPGWVFGVGGATGIVLALYLIPLLLIASLKRRRVRKRRRTGSADRRAGGAWDELVDTYSELGYQASRKATRLQLAHGFESQFRRQVELRRAEREAARAVGAKKAARKTSPARVSSKATLEELPVLPGLRAFAAETDEVVFSGEDVTPARIDALWKESRGAVIAARASVSWWRRQFSKFRIRPRRDWAEALSIPEKSAISKSFRGVFVR